VGDQLDQREARRRAGDSAFEKRFTETLVRELLLVLRSEWTATGRCTICIAVGTPTDQQPPFSLP